MRRDRTCLQADPHEVGRVAAQRGGQQIRITRALTPLDHGTGLIDDVDGGLFVQDIEGGILGHGSAPAQVEDAAIKPYRAPLGSLPTQSWSGSRSAHVEGVGGLNVATGRLACVACLMAAAALNNPA